MIRVLLSIKKTLGSSKRHRRQNWIRLLTLFKQVGLGKLDFSQNLIEVDLVVSSREGVVQIFGISHTGFEVY